MIREAFGSFRDGRCHQVAAVLTLHLLSGLIALGIVVAWVAGVTNLEVDTLSYHVHRIIGSNAGSVFDKLLAHAHLDWRSWAPVVAVLVVLVWNVVRSMSIVQHAINDAAGVTATIKRRQWGHVALKRVFGTAFVTLVSVALVASFSAKTALEVLDYVGVDPVAASPWTFRVIEVILALMLATLLFSGVFRLLPDAKLAMKHVWHGAFWSAKLYTLAQILAAFAIVYGGGMSFYGEAAILLVIIGYLYLSAVSLLWGAQVLRVKLARGEVEPRPSRWAGRVADRIDAPLYAR